MIQYPHGCREACRSVLLDTIWHFRSGFDFLPAAANFFTRAGLRGSRAGATKWAPSHLPPDLPEHRNDSRTRSTRSSDVSTACTPRSHPRSDSTSPFGLPAHDAPLRLAAPGTPLPRTRCSRWRAARQRQPLLGLVNATPPGPAEPAPASASDIASSGNRRS